MPSETEYAMLINGKRVTGSRMLTVRNPATGAVIATVPACSRVELDGAVDAARTAFPAWAATPIEERRARLSELGDAVLAHGDALKRLLTSEQGKPHAEAAAEVGGAGMWLKAASTLEMPVVVNEDSPQRYSETRRTPLGVVGAIAPWNFPLLLAVFKIGPALLAGNTLVLKPSPFTPLATLRFAELAADILPPGVLNVVTGDDELGPWITEHPGIDKVSFTGSTATGKRVMQSAAATLKRVTLELGGNDPAIVMADANVEEIAEQLFWAAFRNNGQICIATKRMYVHEDVYDRLKDALVAYAKTVKVGDGSEQGTQIGPINNEPQYRRVLALIQDARDNGYRFLLGGQATDLPGYFVPITILDNPPEASRIVQEEQFGPVLPLIRFRDIEDVIARANATDFGLGASVWGTDEDRAFALAERIISGTVWVNETQHLSPFAAFGGRKHSGVGVEGGTEGLLEYTSAQTLVRKRTPEPA